MKLLVLITLFINSFNAFCTECSYSLEDLMKKYVQVEGITSDISDEFSCLFEKRNIENDSNKKRSSYSALFPIVKDEFMTISGKMKYYGLVNKKYTYDVVKLARLNKIIIKLNIHFYKSAALTKRMNRCRNSGASKCYNFAGNEPWYPKTDEELYESVEKRLKKAQDIWNNSAPSNIEFEFNRVISKSNAHYSIKLVDRLGALYDKFLFFKFDASIYAHEIGHMLGLGEEYNPMTSNVIPWHTLANNFLNKGQSNEEVLKRDMRCNLESIMCLRDTIYPYHFNEILNRI